MSTRRRHLERLLTVLLLLGFGFLDRATAAPRLVRIALVPDGPWERLGEMQKVVVKEIQDLTHGEHDVQFADDPKFSGDWTVAGVKAALDRAMADRSIDLVLATGFISSTELARLKTY